ncbi:MAG: holo-[acyl-carrier-protein] synthase [Desulfuromonadaceae bacterium GWB2_53_15]|nr:MAG: holo-[acyl-carrier-protein] synthase [Desulfuromonadaceae bacterium GWB2_53_15]
MIAGIGTDIVLFERFQRFIDEGNTSLLQRLFTERERTLCTSRKNSAACYAARFAAKEAFLKALGLGLRDGLSWQDMEVINDDLGKPRLHLSGKALEVFSAKQLSSIFLSLSHDGGYAVAMVVLEA